MLSAGFVHLLGASVVEIGVVGVNGYPLATFLSACGFILTLVADVAAESISSTHPPMLQTSINNKYQQQVSAVSLVVSAALAFPPVFLTSNTYQH